MRIDRLRSLSELAADAPSQWEKSLLVSLEQDCERALAPPPKATSKKTKSFDESIANAARAAVLGVSAPTRLRKTLGKRSVVEKTVTTSERSPIPAYMIPRTPSSAPAKKRAPNAAFMKPMTPSDALAAIIGKGPYPRTEVTMKVWEYIKKNKLQDAVNRRMINADAKLKEIFKKSQASMFEMTKMINNHLK